MIKILSSVFLGWALGANDSANVFGTAVCSKMIKYRTAAILIAIFVILGSVIQGQKGIHTLAGLTTQSALTAFIVLISAAIAVTILTILKLPISTSQAVVGSIIGIGIMNNDLNLSGLTKVIICWIGTPIGGLLFSFILYFLLKFLLKVSGPNLFLSDSILRIGLILSGCYGAYALGANNVANVTGVYAGNLLTPFYAALIGGVSIAFGAVTFSRNVMITVGSSIVKIDAFSAFVSVLAHSLTVHFYALIGVPVSTSQAIVGAVFAIGLIQGVQTIKFNMMGKILSGWLITPLISCGIAIICYFITHLQYVP